MRALCWHGKEDIHCETVPDPQIVDPRDAIIKVTSWPSAARTFILWAASYRGMKSGDVLGHEAMDEVVEVGRIEMGEIDPSFLITHPRRHAPRLLQWMYRQYG